MAHPFGRTHETGTISHKDIIEIRVGSDSDIPKIQPLLDELKGKNVPYILRILSAHRTPDRMSTTAQGFPDIDLEGIPEEIQKTLQMIMGTTKLQVVLCIAGAGGSAHIAGMSASETDIPVIALPVPSSSMGTFDSFFSMVDMPPGIPNGASVDLENIAQMGEQIMNLKKEDTYKIFFKENPTEAMLQMAEENGVEFTRDLSQAKVGIQFLEVYNTHDDSIYIDEIIQSPIPIIVPCLQTSVNSHTVGKIHDALYKTRGLLMGIQKEGSTNPTNAMLYALKLFARHRPEIGENLEKYKNKLREEVIAKDTRHLVTSVCEQFSVTKINLPERYNIGNPDFHHSGKVRETVVHPDNPTQRIMIATDRISTHDVIHKTGIPKKGEVLTSISNYWFEVLAGDPLTADIPTQVVSNPIWPDDFPEELKSRSIIVRSLTPLKVEAVMRKNLTGSGLKAWNIHLDLEECRGGIFEFDVLPIEEKEQIYKKLFPNAKFTDFQKDILDGEWKWEQQPKFEGKYLDENQRVKDGASLKTPIFTPTTKDIKDTPISLAQMKESIASQITEKFGDSKTAQEIETLIENAYTKIQKYTQKIFAVGMKHLNKKGMMLADTKFEFAIDEKGEVVLIDEVMTPDSSRIWTIDIYESTGKMIAHDKQPVRDDAMRQWKEMGKTKEKPPLTFGYQVVVETVNRYMKMKKLFQSSTSH